MYLEMSIHNLFSDFQRGFVNIKPSLLLNSNYKRLCFRVFVSMGLVYEFATYVPKKLVVHLSIHHVSVNIAENKFAIRRNFISEIYSKVLTMFQNEVFTILITYSFVGKIYSRKRWIQNS